MKTENGGITLATARCKYGQYERFSRLAACPEKQLKFRDLAQFWQAMVLCLEAAA